MAQASSTARPRSAAPGAGAEQYGGAASYDDLKDALKENLQTTGVLADLRARIRASVFDSLQDSEAPRPPANSPQADLVNELIREYMRYMGYRHSLSVFAAEADLPRRPPKREALADELGLELGPKKPSEEGGGAEDNVYPAHLPLLYGLSLRHAVKDPAAKSIKR
ncbi:uncharacterized protein EV422DRAFT_78336 [Fimicolochytrium jonesii]|uniref:uncharacterized protein n=1 Tax=Fimicolochytrium jonesii TaxID=1396493 RepID=UPI0022FEBB64|nr:uncharacterized protein EV422DRAFT_78336 [Fimicolochytrium jonesii]KAI8820092.1 hypothetical protein EV422DRAFT_78336 [Fimicolochytrium jonesii]